jgi:hypothetical protein
MFWVLQNMFLLLVDERSIFKVDEYTISWTEGGAGNRRGLAVLN